MKKLPQIVKYAIASGGSWVIDNGFFLLFKTLLASRLGAGADAVCTALARAISSFFNFNCNNRLVFENTGNYGKALVKYYCLAVPQMLVSAGLLTLADNLLGVTEPTLSTLVKIVIDTLLFIASYFIQKTWVFKKNTAEKE